MLSDFETMVEFQIQSPHGKLSIESRRVIFFQKELTFRINILSKLMAKQVYQNLKASRHTPEKQKQDMEHIIMFKERESINS